MNICKFNVGDTAYVYSNNHHQLIKTEIVVVSIEKESPLYKVRGRVRFYDEYELFNSKEDFINTLKVEEYE